MLYRRGCQSNVSALLFISWASTYYMLLNILYLVRKRRPQSRNILDSKVVTNIVKIAFNSAIVEVCGKWRLRFMYCTTFDVEKFEFLFYVCNMQNEICTNQHFSQWLSCRTGDNTVLIDVTRGHEGDHRKYLSEVVFYMTYILTSFYCFAGGLGTRHWVTFMLFLGMANAYIMRTNMSVAIVAMVNHTALPVVAEAMDTECGPISSNSSLVSITITLYYTVTKIGSHS